MFAPLLATLALTAVHTVDLDALFADALPKAKARTQIAVLFPDTMPTDAKHLYAEHWETKRSYTLSLADVPDCGEATACFEAKFRGEQGGAPFGAERVTLAKGRHGRFKPLSCGASCSPPAISWRERGATYTIQAKVAHAKATLVKMANAAIRRGPR